MWPWFLPDGERFIPLDALRTAVSLVGYAVPKVGFDKLIPAFQATEAGKGVTFVPGQPGSGVFPGVPGCRRCLHIAT